MSTSIGVVGTGISGLHLALYLQWHGIDSTIYAEKPAGEIRNGRLQNLVGRFDHTQARERALGVQHWDFPDFAMFCAHLRVLGDSPLAFLGAISRPASFVDFRIYLARLLEDFEERGGRVVLGPVTASDVSRLGADHDLVVVASGRGTMTELFPRDPDRSPYVVPQRTLVAGLYRGIAYPEPVGLSFNMAPGAGEIFQSPIWSFDGPASGLLFEGVPGGPFDALAACRYEEDPRGFEAEVLRLLEQFAPAVRERVDERQFQLAGPRDLLQGAITPTVRHSRAALDSGGFALAIGDAWITNDPITGQGANLGSHCAWTLGQAIVAGGPYDEEFCRSIEERMWEFAGPVTEWTNAFLQPPPPHVVDVLVAAAQNPAVADALIEGFGDPIAMWSRLATPDATAGFLAAYDTPGDTTTRYERVSLAEGDHGRR